MSNLSIHEKLDNMLSDKKLNNIVKDKRATYSMGDASNFLLELKKKLENEN